MKRRIPTLDEFINKCKNKHIKEITINTHNKEFDKTIEKNEKRMLSIYEKNIGKVLDEIKIIIDVSTTKHAEERKLRHGEDTPITNDEIISSAEKALKEIGERQLKGIDEIGKKYWIYNKENKNLNIIAQLNRKGNELILTIITVMRKENFKGSPETHKIDV